MRPLLSLLLLCGAVATAQDTAPVNPQQFVKSEGVQVAYSVTNNTLAPVDALNLMLQCAQPMSAAYDSDNDGRNDTLRVYGFSIVAAQVYQARGVTSLAPALQKAQLRANGAAAEFFGGLQTAVRRSMETKNVTGSVIGKDGLNLSDLSVETVTDAVSTTAQALLRGGRVTGHRIVSLGEQGICVVARYELPLDQRAPQTAPAQRPTGTPTGPVSPAQPGFPLPPPGSTGDF